jgi:glycosyltransferase involved in cell wall biosynthesis
MDASEGELPSARNYRLEVYNGVSDAFKGWPIVSRDLDAVVVCGTGWKAMIGSLRLPERAKRIFFEVMSGKRSSFVDPRLLIHFGFDAIVGQARPVEAQFRREFFWSGPSTAIPALPEPPELFSTVPPYQPQVNSDGSLRFAYFGRLVPHKGLVFLIENWGRFAPPGSTLDVFGTGSDEAVARRCVEERGLAKAISFHGKYPTGAGFVSLAQKFDLKLLPTVGEEGAPLVLLEAMACGLPFVANGVGGIPDYANPDCRITDGDINEFIPAVRGQILAMRKGLIKSDRLQDFYKQNFSFEALVGRWEAFLDNVIGDGFK